VKIYMLWDMEGASGLFTREQTWYWEPGVRPHVAAEGRGLLMSDVRSACAAALAAGADQVVVCDTHHGGGNLVVDQMPADPRIVYHGRSVGIEDGRRRWMPGLDASVDLFMLPGHHAMEGTPGAFLPHTVSSRDWADVRINGHSVGEIGLEACFAGHWNVPLALVQGDSVACAEAREQYPWVVTAEVKRPLGRDQCVGLEPEAGRRLTAEKIGEAIELGRAGRLQPFKPTLPMTVAIELRTIEQADQAAGRPGVRRVDDLIVEAAVERQCDVLKWIRGVGLDMDPERG
jgi:D-amino peptidase